MFIELLNFFIEIFRLKIIYNIDILGLNFVVLC